MQEARLRVLIVDDDQAFRDTFRQRLEMRGFTPLEASDGPEAVRLVRDEPVDLAVVDMRMPGMDGLVTIAKLKEVRPGLRTILLTGQGDDKLREATDGLKADYFEKNDMSGFWNLMGKLRNTPGMIVIAPGAGGDFSAQDMEIMAAKQALDRQAEARESANGKSMRLIGQTAVMQDLKNTIAKVAALDCTVLIRGETGTGKELVARRIHEQSNRRSQRFLAVNCTTFSTELLSNELFGHEREAFTGASKSKKGVFEAVAGGTILLDEIGDTQPAMQVQLLRVLQEKNIIRVGGTHEIPVDLRILAATNKSLKEKVAGGNFREDLYYRLNAFTLRIPPLRERRDDIQPLAAYFLAKYNREFGKELEGFDQDVMDMLMQYPFPGNVRELENIVERGAILCDKGLVGLNHLPERFKTFSPQSSSQQGEFLSLAELEERHILEVLTALGGNKNKAAKVLGISRASLWRKLKQIESKSNV